MVIPTVSIFVLLFSRKFFKDKCRVFFGKFRAAKQMKPIFKADL